MKILVVIETGVFRLMVPGASAQTLPCSTYCGIICHCSDQCLNLEQTIRRVLPSTEICHMFLEPTAAGSCREHSGSATVSITCMSAVNHTNHLLQVKPHN